MRFGHTKRKDGKQKTKKNIRMEMTTIKKKTPTNQQIECTKLLPRWSNPQPIAEEKVNCRWETTAAEKKWTATVRQYAEELLRNYKGVDSTEIVMA